MVRNAVGSSVLENPTPTEVIVDEVQSGARAPDQPGPVRQTAGQATEAAGQAARNVTQTAREQTRQVSGEVAAQARGVAADVRDSVTNQAHTQNDRLVESIRRLADELDEMAYDRKDSPARTVVSRVAHSSRQLADHLADRGPEGVLAEVQDFARRRPGTFLMSAAVAGFVVGRLGKGVLNATGPDRARAAGTGYAGGSTEYLATGTGTPVPVTEQVPATEPVPVTPPAPVTPQNPWQPPPTPPSAVPQ